jgi:ATP-dependent helicase/nuclease subunit A
VPVLVRPLDSLPEGARVNEQQLAAVEATGEVFVSAGAGTGKTAVLVERFVRAVCERGLDVESVLVITYTRKAAGELRARIRKGLVERGRPDLARELDGAYISTIHGFCNRLLKAYPFAAGLDPRFRELDEAQAAVLRSEAFDAALGEFCATDDPERLQLLATYGAAGLRRMLTRVYETLRSAGREPVLELGESLDLRACLDELRDAAQCLADDTAATDAQRTAARAALDLVAERTLPERLLDLGDLRPRSSERAATYNEATRRVEQAALDEVARRDRDLLQELLDRFGEAYAAAKRAESALDFEDLQLIARDLLRADDAIREREQLRFRSIMVDEFQDTNRLQCELVDLLRGPGTEVFFVGDEFQSIYGFRHADVAVFRERRESAEQLLPLTRNYRSRPEVLAAVNQLFGARFGGEFQPLAASGEFPDPVFGHPVELLVTDKESFREDDSPHWRRGEAKAIARRVRELVDTGAAEPGEIVLLFAAGTDAEAYEEELRELGLPTYRATGRGYFGQQQVADLLAYLRLLQNRYDDVALLTVLASPLVGVSNDALVLLRRAASKRPLFVGLEKTLPPGLGPDDERLLKAFRQRYDRLVAMVGRVSLELLCERIVAGHDYDLAVLAQWDGRRRYANLRKLARLARSYEELRGNDLEGFVRFVAEQEAVGSGERDAVAEEEGGAAVRLLTIHAAKGLEFKVVIVADAGREKAAPSADEILALADGRFGFRVVDPATSKRRPAFGYEQVKAARKAEEEDERLRLYYVAMTRAIDRLIVSGAIDRSRAADATTPIGWVLEQLELGEELDAARDEPVEVLRGDAQFLVRVHRFAPEVAAVEPALPEEGQLELFAELPVAEVRRVVPPLAPLEPPPVPPLHRIRRLSFTALAEFDSCSYKYFARRVAQMKEVPTARVVAEGETPALAATEIGHAVHRLLEHPELELASVREDYPQATDDELARVSGLVANWRTSELARRVDSLPGATREQHFTFEHDGVLLHGFLDVFHLADRCGLVVDYKTNVLGEREPAEIVDSEYRLQRLVYALACFRAGAQHVEVAYAFLERPDALVVTEFDRAALPELEAELSHAIARIHAGDFRPTPSDWSCSGCPALDLVCAGPRLHGGAAMRLEPSFVSA